MASPAEKEDSTARGGFRFPWWLIALILVLAALLLQGEKGLLSTWRTIEYKQQLEARLLSLEAENQELRTRIEALRNDSRYLEAIARQELGMVREDELVYQFLPPRPEISAPAPHDRQQP